MIKIKKTLKCDTRTLPKGAVVTEDDAFDDTTKHRKAVIACGKYLSEKIKEQFEIHDWTKLGIFLPQFTDALNKGFESKEMQEWYDMHVHQERHHLKKHVPEDVNLIDVLEMICDCSCAGMARSGKVFDIDIDPEVLMKAFKNTANLIISNIKVED